MERFRQLSFTARLEHWHAEIKLNKWFRYFAVFNRIGLAAGFLPSGYVKIMGERFTSLSVNHPLGHYLEALWLTGWYYTFIGIMQVTAAVLLLIPRTATLGALIYFPIILNICLLSFSVRFDGSLISSPLMVLANLYLLCWDYDKLKHIFSFRRSTRQDLSPEQKKQQNKFPVLFFAGVFCAIAFVFVILFNVFDIKPRNTLNDCNGQCKDSPDPAACIEFCDCIHQQGLPLSKCLEAYHKAIAAGQHSK